MSPFTDEVLSSLGFLRRAINEVAAIDVALSETLTAITDDLIVNLENQMLLVFANIGVRRKADQEDLLKKRADTTILEEYLQACGASPPLENVIHSVKPKPPKPSDGERIARSTLQMVPEPSVQRTLLSGIHLLLESLGFLLGVERVTLFVNQKGTGTLRVVVSAPDITLARKGSFIASHQGIVGSVFSTGIAIRADRPTADTRRNFIDPFDIALGVKTENFLAFPVLEKSSGNVVGVLECANKAIDFSEDDEVLVAEASRLLWYLLFYHDVDFHNGAIFNPASLHALRPYRASVVEDLRDYHGAASVSHRQLVVRLKKDGPETAIESIARSLGFKKDQGEIPLAIRGKHQPSDAVEIDTLGRVRELKGYLDKVEDAHRHVMSELVSAQRRETELREECAKKAYRIRLMEENVQSLHDRLTESRKALNSVSFAQNVDANSTDYESSMLTLGNFLKGGSLERLPAISSAPRQEAGTVATKQPNFPAEDTSPSQIFENASKTIRDLRRLVQSDELVVGAPANLSKVHRVRPLGHPRDMRDVSTVQYKKSKQMSRAQSSLL